MFPIKENISNGQFLKKINVADVIIIIQGFMA